MKILHYLPGLPPVRKGGLLKYAYDLMEVQRRNAEVFLMIPGEISLIKQNRNKVRIVRKGFWKKIPLFCVRNSLPIPMANGIRDITWYTQECEEKIYLSFLQKLSPDIIHIHTFMGLHLQFLQAAKKCGIPVVFTTHDYFGICPKTDLFMEGCDCEQPGEHCEACCKYAFSTKRLVLEQSRVYALYRKDPILTRILQTHALRRCFTGIRSYTPEQCMEQTMVPAETETGTDYQYLLSYYRKMFELVTYFHFNSTIAREVYEKHLGDLQGQVLTITNGSIKDQRRTRKVGEEIRLGYFGGDTPHKGLHLLQKALQELQNEGVDNIRLYVFGNTERADYDFCRYFDAFLPEEMEQAYEQIDLLAIPSQWKETFAMVALEAISLGIPVMMTPNVGAWDVLSGIPGEAGILVDPTREGMKKVLGEISRNPGIINDLNRNIMQADMKFGLEEHVAEMDRLYEEARKLL